MAKTWYRFYNSNLWVLFDEKSSRCLKMLERGSWHSVRYTGDSDIDSGLIESSYHPGPCFTTRQSFIWLHNAFDPLRTEPKVYFCHQDLLKPHNIGTHLKGTETKFLVVPLFLKSFHLWVSCITFWNFLKIPSVFIGLIEGNKRLPTWSLQIEHDYRFINDFVYVIEKIQAYSLWTETRVSQGMMLYLAEI
jgi:hypothetical protein